MASNALAVVRASLRAAHGKEAEAEVSGYYLADEVAAEYRTLAKYLPAEKWKGWRELGAKEMASLLTEIARQVNMAELHRNQRGPKKPPDKKPVYNRKHKHFETVASFLEFFRPRTGLMQGLRGLCASGAC